jgi:hypothetical protein
MSYQCNESGHKAKDSPRNSMKMSSKGSKEWSLITAFLANVNAGSWHIESGATNHMTNCVDQLENYCPCKGKEVLCANHEKIHSEGVGDVKIRINKNGIEKVVKNVMFLI